MTLGCVMMKRSIGKMVDASYDSPRTKKRHVRYHIHLEREFVEDEEFPFKPDDKLLVQISDGKLIIEKL